MELDAESYDKWFKEQAGAGKGKAKGHSRR